MVKFARRGDIGVAEGRTGIQRACEDMRGSEPVLCKCDDCEPGLIRGPRLGRLLASPALSTAGQSGATSSNPALGTGPSTLRRIDLTVNALQ